MIRSSLTQRCWPLVCLSPNVSADDIVARWHRLTELLDQRLAAFPDVRLLLGHVGRARFPNDERFVSLVEYAVNEPASYPSFQLGHMTEQERQEILFDAEERQRRLHEARLEAAERKGREEGVRESMLQLVLQLAPHRISEFEAIADASDLQRAVLALVRQ